MDLIWLRKCFVKKFSKIVKQETLVINEEKLVFKK